MKNTPNCASRSKRFEIRIAGAGGQGIILAGVLLAEASLISGNHVAQTQSYGAESRGGNSTSDVIISDTDVDYPRATRLDLLVALTQEACDQNLPAMKEDGTVITDADLVRRVLWSKAITLPLAQIAKQSGEERAINIAALGALTAFCPSVSPESMISALQKRFPPAKLEANKLAFEEARKHACGMTVCLDASMIKEDYEP